MLFLYSDNNNEAVLFITERASLSTFALPPATRAPNFSYIESSNLRDILVPSSQISLAIESINLLIFLLILSKSSCWRLISMSRFSSEEDAVNISSTRFTSIWAKSLIRWPSTFAKISFFDFCIVSKRAYNSEILSLAALTTTTCCTGNLQLSAIYCFAASISDTDFVSDFVNTI